MTRTVFITGATAGIGEATVRRFAAGGWRENSARRFTRSRSI